MSIQGNFEPKEFEAKTYAFWEENQFFSANDTNEPGQKSFCIMIPPPNVTGVLHIGHALTNTIQDILVRWHRMQGNNTLWMPGTDHAGIATQTQVEKQIAKEGKGPTGRPLSRHDLGREKFLERVWQWKHEHASHIKNQLMRMGSSLDWKRERFTMDEGLSLAVREVFVRLFEEGLIYRGERIINWCTRCSTALSDLEVDPTDRKGSLWYIKYPIEGTSEALIVATTRPETLLGDSAVAIHPSDERFKKFHGKKAKLPLMDRLIPVITDEYVDREFGTGALKITPAHDFNDFDLGLKHKLEMIEVMGKDGRITAAGGPYAGLKFTEAREKVVADLTEKGLLEKVEPYALKLGLCQRCSQVAEPMVSKQWFVKTGPLAKPAIEAVENKQIQFLPVHHEKIYYEWMRNIRDWCISRQLWWGHQIPAWYCGDCEHITVSRTAPSKCGGCGGAKLRQDDDVLDTWFSSGLWPFGTLGWPEKTPALKTFYPGNILETGSDILFFWVARMIMMGMHIMKEVPFKWVYLHNMVRDEKGEKMSKTKGNVVDPLVLIDQHGADPLRFTLASYAGQGRDIKLSVDRVESNRAFCNKFWNATKYFFFQNEPEPLQAPSEGLDIWIRKNYRSFHPVNRWIISRLQKTTASVIHGFENFALDESCRALYEFTWLEFCDWYIEFSKTLIKESKELRRETLYVLHWGLEQMFKIQHPVMPFVTEELWQKLPWKTVQMKVGKAASLMVQKFPTSDSAFIDEAIEEEVESIRKMVEALRNFKGENNISPKNEFPVVYGCMSTVQQKRIDAHERLILSMARISSLKTGQGGELDAIIPIPEIKVEFRISLKGLVDVEEESKRIHKEIDKAKADLSHVQKKLTQETFMAKAPPALVAQERENEKMYLEKLGNLEKSLKRLEKLKA